MRDSHEQIDTGIDDIGPIQYKRSRRARHLNIRIKPHKGVEVSVPSGMSLSAAERLVSQKRDWIVRNLQKVKQFEADSVIYDGTRAIRTRWHRLRVQPNSMTEVRYKISKDEILVRYPARLELTAPQVQAAIHKGLIEAYRQEAKRFLPERLAALARQHGFSYNRLFIKNHRSRWGSCSSKNNINLSLHLLRLPDHLIDYVMLHELVHTEIKNHSVSFWGRLQEVCPQVQALRKELRQKTKELRTLGLASSIELGSDA
ncbi:M48 family metallopeptidase [bacterium]|nr:M48 family metallopeptidase [bacterium]